MSIKAKLFFCSEERELSHTNLDYHRFTRFNGKPSSGIIGGYLTVTFTSEMYDDSFLEAIIADRNDKKSIEYPFNLYELHDGKIVFYKHEIDGQRLFEYSFKDAVIIEYKETFDNQIGMQVTLTISPAIQDYRLFNETQWDEKSPTRLIKPWEENYIPPSKKTGYKSTENTQEKEQFFVEEIEVENLDEGSTNSGANDKMGMIYGKEYRLKVTKYRNNKLPKDNKTVKWSYSYTNAEGVATIGNIKQTGGIITFKTDDLDYCGNKITFYAYIKNKENEANLKVFHHYRFRWFDRIVFEREINDRISTPYLVEQNGTSLCGMACLFYLFVDKNKDKYKKYALELHSKGKVKYPNFFGQISKELFEVNPATDSNYPSNYRGKMPYADWIVLAGTRNIKSSSYTGKKGEDFDAINWPWVMTSVAKDLMDYKEVSSKGCYTPIKPITYSSIMIKETIEDINKQINNGYKIILMIDSDMIADDFSPNPFILEYHWIALETTINSDYIPGFFKPKKDKLFFKAYSWKSKNTYLQHPITHSHFFENYYGYIKLK